VDSIEVVILIFSAIAAFSFFKTWYQPLKSLWPPDRNRISQIVLGLLPIVFLGLMIFILRNMASFDVVNDKVFILFYIILGYVWIALGLYLMSLFFDIHLAYDAIQLNNKAALAAVTGNFFVLAFIYAGSNVGDGPGWWCVLFAGSLGLAAWIILGIITNICTNIFERITVDRDIGCGIRFMIYLICSGVILGYACSGDWTSFYMTIIEFSSGWPVLPLTAVYILIELIFKKLSKHEVSA